MPSKNTYLAFIMKKLLLKQKIDFSAQNVYFTLAISLGAMWGIEKIREFLKKEPAATPYFHPWYGAREFINRCPRYCLYLGDCSPSELNRLPRY